MKNFETARFDILNKIEALGGFSSKVKTWVLAYSGGADSRLLLHFLVNLLPSDKALKVIHVNHGLSKNAESWENHAKETLAVYSEFFKSKRLELLIKRVTVSEEGSIEDNARNARYAAIESEVDDSTVVFMGHHKNDNAETILFRLFRGTGISGLAGIPEKRKFGQGILIRPMLLTLTRKEIESAVSEKCLKHVHDESNSDDKFTRNFIRNKVIPLLSTKFPNLVFSLTAFAEKASENQSLLEEIAESDCLALASKHKRLPVEGLDLKKLTELSPLRRRNALVHFLKKVNGSNQEVKTLLNLEKVLFTENVNNCRLRKVSYGNVVVVTNGNLVWID